VPNVTIPTHKHLCVRDPDLMFPFDETESGPPSPGERRALDVCSACPSLLHCRRWAVSANLSHGVVGGLTRSQRRGLGSRLAVLRPDEPRQNRQVLATVLAAQREFRPAREVDPEIVSALMDGVTVDAGPWERAVAAVALVLRGLAKVQVQRDLGVHARQLLRWCERYAVGEPLVHPERVWVNGGHRHRSSSTGARR
jgi:hypothetical protein